ncbi:MAG TPA: 2-isopropylmalate synthase, partial [bacterium]|nr:2-isopropylmalate synthase [bacterium]
RMEKLIIFDTTLRDGEQSPGASLTISEKLAVAKQLEKLGVDVIEAGFPIASQGDFEAVKKIAETVSKPAVCGLARANTRDIDRCWEAVQHANNPRIHTFIATSKVHREAKLRKNKDQILKITEKAVKRAKSYTDNVEFSPEDAARTNLDYMCDVVKVAIEAGAKTINIPDTVGYANPEEFGERIKYLIDQIPNSDNVIISVHCHNDLGNAVANSLAAVRNGARQVEGCINGIGERAGNASLEEIIMNIETRKDYYNLETNINTEEIYKTSRLVSTLTGLLVQRNKAIVGENAFAHEAGIHQHGVLSDKNTYEIMTPEKVGWKGQNIVIGKHSGKHAVTSVLEEEGFELEKEQIKQITKKVKDLADKQKKVATEEVIAIAREVTHQLTDEEKYIELLEMTVTCGINMTPVASLKLKVDGKEIMASGFGDGPIDAVSNAIWEILESSYELEDYHLDAITGGTNALADVSIKLLDSNNNLFSARAVNEDVVKASAYAIIKGINKAYNYRKKIHPQKNGNV